jgi:signal transduction histidine kinase
VLLRDDRAAPADRGAHYSPGIAADRMLLAMEPFERLPKARDGDQSGFGLGPAVCKAVAEGHDGELI